MNKAAAILKLDAALNKYGTAFKGSTAAALPASLGRGKAYFAGARPPLRLVGTDDVGEDAVRLTFVAA